MCRGRSSNWHRRVIRRRTCQFFALPDDRFANLRGFPFAPHYVEISGARVHYVDEGEGETILCLHGEPTWSYLYRKMIPILALRHRVIAMDFIGFGRSDKFSNPIEYTYEMHRATLTSFIEKLELRGITAVVQDWGGLIGLRVATQMDDRFARLVIMNTGLPTGDVPATEGFLKWRAYAMNTPDLPCGTIVRRSAVNRESITDEIVAAYDAPFPDATYKAGAQMFPRLVPSRQIRPAPPICARLARRCRSGQSPRWLCFPTATPLPAAATVSSATNPVGRERTGDCDRGCRALFTGREG